MDGSKTLSEKLDKLVDLLIMQSKRIEEEARNPLVYIASHKDFEDITRRFKLVFLFLWAEWCGPCLLLRRKYAKIAKQYAGVENIVFAELDIDKNMKLVEKLGVEHIPALLVIYNNNVIDGLVGVIESEVLRSKITSYVEEYVKTT